MKNDRSHEVPLTKTMLGLLPPRGPHDAAIFPDINGTKTLQLAKKLARQIRPDYDITQHGFRTTFENWAAGKGISWDRRRIALAHVRGGKVDHAYQGTETHIADRRKDQEAWCDYCEGLDPQ